MRQALPLVLVLISLVLVLLGLGHGERGVHGQRIRRDRSKPLAADPERSAVLFSAPRVEEEDGELGMARNVIIFDTTLRDGEQAPGNTMTPEEKLRLARQLDALGVDVMEAGFPAASDGDFRSVRDIAQEIRRPVIAALARCHDRDIELAGECASGRPPGAGCTSSSRPRTCIWSTSSG